MHFGARNPNFSSVFDFKIFSPSSKSLKWDMSEKSDFCDSSLIFESNRINKLTDMSIFNRKIWLQKKFFGSDYFWTIFYRKIFLKLAFLKKSILFKNQFFFDENLQNAHLHYQLSEYIFRFSRNISFQSFFWFFLLQ